MSPGLLDRLRGREIDIYYDRRDISVIYLFLEGELVGEAYCTEFLGQRVSIWEARCPTKSRCGTGQGSRSRESGKSSAHPSKRPCLDASSSHLKPSGWNESVIWISNATKFIPKHVQATLQALKEQQNPSASSPRKTLGFLPPAVPEDDPPGTELAPLPVRKLRRDDD